MKVSELIALLFIVEGQQERYGSRRAWEAC
jgi:hypothetical protein